VAFLADAVLGATALHHDSVPSRQLFAQLPQLLKRAVVPCAPRRRLAHVSKRFKPRAIVQAVVGKCEATDAALTEFRAA